MTPRAHHPCPFAAEVEAAHDGRLGAPDLPRLDRHVAGCAACLALRARLDAVRAEARREGNLALDDLARRRARADLLQRAARPGRTPLPTWGRFALGVATALALLVVSASVWRRGARPLARDHALAHVEASPGTRWSRGSSAREERIVLGEGILLVEVPHQHLGHRFVVALPDGEIEVRGTRFEVEVRALHTRRLDVTDGVVALRLEGRAEQLLAAGARWPTAPAAGDLAATHPRVRALPAQAVVPVERARTPQRTRPARDAQTASVVADEPVAPLAAGLRALQRGDLSVAAERFADFERAHPDDERAEDAGYLRVVALRRAGLTAEAGGAAEAYLRRYSHGARRWEVLAGLARVGASNLSCAELTTLAAEFEGDVARREAMRPLRASCGR
ncbi:MAG: hypothetical protein EPO40_02750 [Myxococcaceae bacterium]|nr:MAG: hypothetical protein EPO40_02750 [Myxococcaceae bacterium]